MKKILYPILAVMIILVMVVGGRAALTQVGSVNGQPWFADATNPVPITGTLQLAASGTSNLVLTGGTISNTVPPTGYTTFGQGSLTWTGTNTSILCLSGTGATSVPCSQVILSVTGTGVLCGSSSTSVAFPVPATPFTLPLSNVNQLYLSGGTYNTAKYLYFK